MTFCPSDERLVQLLEEQLDRRELVDIEQHLEQCEDCQGTLEELTRERFSFVEWRPWSDASLDGDDRPAGSTDGRGSSRRSFSKGAHPHTLPSDFGSGSEFEETPEVEGYEILGKLGHGGMGVVYRARQHGLERLVALKMIRGGPHAAPEHLARFRIEARSVARLRHPNVVQIFDVGHSGGLPFVALELLEGGSLEGRVAGTPQPERSSAELLVTLAGAIGAAHKAGVVHRDLKSANVLFSPDGVPKIADFGLAKRLDEEDGQTHSGQVMGSPSFMAPEQARGKGREVGPPADLYSLGAILYEQLTGRPPFKGPSAMETLFQVVHDEPIPPSRLRPGLSRDLETICLKCLAKEPSKRYATAEALANDLNRYLAGEPVLARRTGLEERAWKWARRKPAAATLAVFAMTSIIGLTAAAIRARQVEGVEAGIADRLRVEAYEALTEGKVALGIKDWDSGLKGLNAALARIAANPRLDDVREKIKALIARLENGQAEQKKVADARRRFETFKQLRRRTQLDDTQFIGVGEIGNNQAIRETARLALSEFPTKGSGDDFKLEPLPDALTDAEKAEVEQGSYELLLIWAEATTRPAEGEEPRRQAEQALALLDRAEKLHAPTKAYHLLKANCLSLRGDKPGAEAEKRLADAMPMTDAFGHVLLGQQLYHRHQIVPAIREFEAALQLEPEQFRAQLLLAICQIQIQYFNEAKANLTACLQREPKAISLYVLRGFAYGEEGNVRQKLAREANPRLTKLEAEAESQFEAAEADFRTAWALNPDDGARYALLVNRGALRLRRHRIDEAQEDFRSAIALKPDQVVAYIPLGQALKQQGRVEEAVEQYNKALSLKPNMAGLYRSRALARLDRGRPSSETLELALTDLTEAIRLDRPGSSDYATDQVRRARLLLLAGRPQDALADCEDALRAVPENADALLLRVKSLLELKRVEEVVAACNDAIGRGKPSAELYEFRGLARSGRQEYAGAIQDFTQALVLDPARPSPLIHRGWAYLVSEAPKLALLDFDEAIRIAPDDPDAYNGRGFAHALQGHHRAAVADADESLKHGTPDARTTYNAARVYAKAASAATNEGPRRGLGQIQVASDYQDHAQTLIRQAIERLPANQRGAFWRDVVQADPALAAIRQRPKFSQLAGQIGRLAK